MKKFWESDNSAIFFILKIFLCWRILLSLIDFFAQVIPLEKEFIGQIGWANFDGEHYLSITAGGYGIYQQAFFPFFPMLIKTISYILYDNYLISGLLIVHFSFLVALYFFYKLVRLDFSEKIAQWSVLFLTFFPTSFFFAATYTESMFLMLAMTSFYFTRKYNFMIGGILSGLASATRFVGIFLLPSLITELYLQNKNKVNLKTYVLSLISIIVLSSSGLLLYMLYLWKRFGDPFLFVHSLPGFGVEKSGGQIILLPQVIFRYFKIFLNVPLFTEKAFIALLEISLFSFFLLTLVFNMKKIRLSYLFFGILSTVVPTFSGTLSSMPRYLLVAFPVFIILGSLKSNLLKFSLLIVFLVLLLILTSYFLRGYFIA